MKILVVLMLTFMDGTYLQETGRYASSVNECSQIIEKWHNTVKENIELWRKEPSTFITGCVKK